MVEGGLYIWRNKNTDMGNQKNDKGYRKIAMENMKIAMGK